MKKFGKLRQWTDEKLGASHKTIATEEFREMEAEMQLRQQGLDSIHQASLAWMKILGKQIRAENQEKEKSLPLDHLGAMLHGNDFASDSAYGNALRLFGSNQQAIARIQDSFQQSVNEDILLNMQRSLAAMTEYQNARKKLESRRLTYDSALSKAQKAKKEDSKLEEDLRGAKIRYEEISVDVQQRMVSIREAEVNHLRDIMNFVDAEAEYHNKASHSLNQLRASLHLDVLSSTNPTTSRSEEDDNLVCPTPRRLGAQQDNLDKANMHNIDDKSNLRCTNSQISLTSSIQQEPLICGDRSPNSQDVSDVLAGLRQVACGFASVRTRSHLSSSQNSSQTVVDQPRKVMLVNFSFEAEATNEMTIRAGDLVEVLEEVSAGWWRGQILGQRLRDDSRCGLFPVNYCTLHSEADPEFTILDSRRSNVHDKQSTRSSVSVYAKSWGNDVAQMSSRNIKQLCPAAESSSSSTKTRPPPPPIPKKKQFMRNGNSLCQGGLDV